MWVLTGAKATLPFGEDQVLTFEDQSLIASSRKRILVVEDDIQMSKFIQFKLNYLGYEVAGSATNCSDAMSRAFTLRPDLILMDIMLDGGDDGIETAQKIIDRQHVPIIYLTAHEDDALFERAKITEPFGYLIKPFNDRDLRIVIETSLFRHEQEKRIKQALQDVRNVLDSSVDIMITYDLEGHIIEFNRRAVDAFGLKRRIATKLSILALLADTEDRCILLDGDPQAIHEHEQIRFSDHEGQSFHADLVLSPLRDQHDRILGRLLVASVS